MSHDRGCPCGKEPYEYADCVDSSCLKKDNRMEDTDWRPSSCPVCGEMREAARTPVCRNPDCGEDVAKRNLRMFKPKEEKRYVWIRANFNDATIISDPVALWQDPNFDREKDRIHELGAEVEVMVTVNVKHKPVYRSQADQDFFQKQ